VHLCRVFINAGDTRDGRNMPQVPFSPLISLLQISALEIERVLLDCPAVKEIAVFGVADAVWGEG
jgi:hypothetical protein